MSFSPFNPFVQPPPRKPQNQNARAGQKPLSEKEQKKAKRNEVLRFMFNPELGQGFDSLKQTHGLFLSLVANVFLQTGLIDASYPGLHDPQKLKFITLVEAAYRGLEFTREGMPRVLLFGAFVGSIFAVVLSVLIFMAHLATGPSRAPAPQQQIPAHIQQQLQQRQQAPQ